MTKERLYINKASQQHISAPSERNREQRIQEIRTSCYFDKKLIQMFHNIFENYFKAIKLY